MSYAVSHFFLNGGADALIVRVHHESVTGRERPGQRRTCPPRAVERCSSRRPAPAPGATGCRRWRPIPRRPTRPRQPRHDLFHLTIQETDGQTPPRSWRRRSSCRLSLDPVRSSLRADVLEQQSDLVRVLGAAARGSAQMPIPPAPNPPVVFADGDDGDPISDLDVAGANFEDDRRGIFALENADLFNLLCIPPFTDTATSTRRPGTQAAAYCDQRRRAMLHRRPAGWPGATARRRRSAGRDASVVTPQPERRPLLPAAAAADPLAGEPIDDVRAVRRGRRRDRPHRRRARRLEGAGRPRRDARRASASSRVQLTDGENGQLNPLGVNCLRSFPVRRPRRLGRAHAERRRPTWPPNGSTSRCGAPRCSSRRACIAGTQWVVFEPNDEPLWAQIRLNVGAFMHGLFRQGAFQGTTPREAYFVKCDSETTTQDDIDRGIVNIVVGFAPLKPAEFVVIKHPADRRPDRGVGERHGPVHRQRRSASTRTRTSSSG